MTDIKVPSLRSLRQRPGYTCNGLTQHSLIPQRHCFYNVPRASNNKSGVLAEFVPEWLGKNRRYQIAPTKKLCGNSNPGLPDTSEVKHGTRPTFLHRDLLNQGAVLPGCPLLWTAAAAYNLLVTQVCSNAVQALPDSAQSATLLPARE